MISAAARGATRVAIIATGAGESLKNISSVAEAELSSESDFTLLERQQIDHVITEQKLSLTGMIDATSAIQVGKILSTDLLDLIEGEPSSPQFGLVIFDPGTGVQLWNAAATSANGEAAAAEIVKGIKASAAKRAEVAHRKTVCIMAVRNGDLSRQFDSLCDAVGRLTERGMVSSPAVAMLERSRLDQVTRERALAADAATRTLLASLVIVDLEIDRGSDASSLKATALLSDSSSRSIGKFSVEARDQDAAALANALVAALNQNLKTPATAPLDNRAEAARFCSEALFRIHNSDFAHSVTPAEAAHALSPGNAGYRAVLARNLIDAGWQQFKIPDGGGGRNRGGWENHSVAPPTVLRGVEMLAEIQAHPATGDAATIQLMRGQFLDSLATLRNFISIANSAPEREHWLPTGNDIPTIKNALRNMLLADDALRAKAVGDIPSFEEYSDWVVALLKDNNSLYSTSAGQWSADIKAIGQGWLATRNRIHAPWSRATMSAAEALASGWQFREFYGGGVAYQPDHHWPLESAQLSDFQALQQVFAIIQDPVLHVYAKLLETCWKAVQNDREPEAIKIAVDEFMAFAQASLDATPRTQPANRLAIYRQMIIATILLDQTPFRGKLETTLAEQMLARHEMAVVVIDRAARQREKESPTDFAARRIPILTSAIKNAATADFLELDDRTPEQWRTRYETYLKGSGALVTAATTHPTDYGWYGASRLIDIAMSDSPILSINHLRIDGGSIDLLAVIDAGNKRPFQLQLLQIPLTGGELRKLGKLTTAIAYRNNQKPWQRELFSELVSDACAADGYYAAAVGSEGVVAFPTSGGTPVQIGDASGMPAKYASKVAVLNGVVYAGLGLKGKETYIAGYDLANKKIDVIASSVRKDKKSPFDDNRTFQVISLLPDAPRQRLIVTAMRRDDSPSTVTGIWEFKPATHAWRQLLPITLAFKEADNRTGAPLFTTIDSVRPASSSELLVQVSAGLFVFDLTIDQARKVYLDETDYLAIPRQTPRLDRVGDALKPAMNGAYQRYTWRRTVALSNIDHDSLWTSFGRVSLATGAIQDFINPRQYDRNVMSCVISLADGRIVLGDNWGLLLINARPNHDRMRENLTPLNPTN